MACFGFGLIKGASWVVAFFTASLAGAGITIISAGLYYNLHMWRQARTTRPDQKPETRRASLSDAVTAWEADRLEDAMSNRFDRVEGRRADRHVTPIADLMHLWEQDARVEMLDVEHTRPTGRSTQAGMWRQRG